MTRAERRREERESRLAPALDPKVPRLRRVSWELPVALVEWVRTTATRHGISEVEFAEMLVGLGAEQYTTQMQKRADDARSVRLVPGAALTRLRSQGACLGGAG